MERKTFTGWNNSGVCLGAYLAPGDQIDAALVQWFLNVTPPSYWRCDCIQLGEAHNYVEGRQTFPTVYRDGHDVWRFAGYCWRGEIVPAAQRGN